MRQCLLRAGDSGLLGQIRKRFCSHRINPVGVQMLPPRLREKVFPNSCERTLERKALTEIQDHLAQHKLLGVEAAVLPETEVSVPDLAGSSITDHFQNVGEKYCSPYVGALQKLLESDVPPIPPEFAMQAGWVSYSKDGSKFKSVEAPSGDAVVFDVETVVTEGGLPAMAVALTATRWYTWCSPALADGRTHHVEQVTPYALIPMHSGSRKKHRVIIGHNVGFDRGYIKEQYSLENSNTRFLDTLSMHVCVSGQTSEQKIMSMSVRKKRLAFEDHLKTAPESSVMRKPVVKIKWLKVSCLNNLGDVYRLYCGQELEKSARETFVTGSSDDVRTDFQFLMKYCALDVLATRNVLCKLFPMFQERFPHPATFFGMLETLTAYLPINSSWKKYLESSKRVYEELDSEIQRCLNHLAKENCSLLENEGFKSDPWLWDLDWSIQEPKPRKSNGKTSDVDEETHEPQVCSDPKPKWFRYLCDKNTTDEPKVPDWESGPWNSSLLKRSIPKLLRITWDGYPVHYHSEFGWGYLIPDVQNDNNVDPSEIPNDRRTQIRSTSKTNGRDFPLEAYLKVIDDHRRQQTTNAAKNSTEQEDVNQKLSELGDFSKLDNDWKEVSEEAKVFSTGLEPSREWPSSVESSYDIGLRGVKFKKLPRRPGSVNNVGSPLSRLMIEKYWGSRLSSHNHKEVTKIFDMAKNTSYWKSVRDRISEQVAVWNSEDQGAILPRIMPAGTIYRKPVDRTWSTTSLASKDRIGSEFKAMIQAPEGFHFVGNHAGSKELWIAALLGDAEFAQMHGSTAFSWRVLQGRLIPEIGLHMATANIVGCTEQQAKVLDLIRLHGGGQKPLCKILSEFKPEMTQTEVALRIDHLLKVTKGERQWPQARYEPITASAISPFKRLLTFADGKRYTQVKKWAGGSESHAFNRIEKIAASNLPSTPFLEARVTRALEPRVVFSKYAVAKMNWVLQSSAADFQHLVLLSTKHLFDTLKIKGRLVLTMNEETKYMVNSNQRYKAALALHISNLYAASFFAERVGMDDLPQSAAFCPFVTVDKVLQRDVSNDCVTPSNPNGLYKTYGIAPGEELNIYQTLEKLGESS